MGIFNSKPAPEPSPTELESNFDEQPTFVPYSDTIKKASRRANPSGQYSSFLISKAVPDPGPKVSGSDPKSIEDRTRVRESSAIGHNSYPTTRMFGTNIRRRRTSAPMVPHSSREAGDDYFSVNHHTGSGISWSDKAYDRTTPDVKNNKK
ncbi:unnamed protein product [Clonostachys byssicola]|uniref:Uncharacterized protein n=1 Tax=Clonostachys byssicola TaxID=160290 RepID=A0A9N9UHU0_9HYPO|nr:unnamed protein product [Clonostachys byssicola]